MTNICFVTCHGVAGDPVFEWLPRIFASHRDVFVYLGEGVRAKHFGERGREERARHCPLRSIYGRRGGILQARIRIYAYRAFKIHDHQFRLKSTKSCKYYYVTLLSGCIIL